jgi:hypothetical protein
MKKKPRLFINILFFHCSKNLSTQALIVTLSLSWTSARLLAVAEGRAMLPTRRVLTFSATTNNLSIPSFVLHTFVLTIIDRFGHNTNSKRGEDDHNAGDGEFHCLESVMCGISLEAFSDKGLEN